jgi:hypothetical protein
MGLELTPIDRDRLTPAVQKALTGPARLMAARGVMPLPTPGELATALYQLSLDAEAAIAQAAKATAAGLPEKVVAGVLADGKLDARVLDWIAPRALGNPALFDQLIRNPAIADQTVAAIAGKATAAEVDQIANNEQRLLRHPEIIAAMYTNRYARMSTVDRAIELAVRNDIRVPGLAAWDEIARALEAGEPADTAQDSLFEKVIANADDRGLTEGDAEAVEYGEANDAVLDRAQQILQEEEDKVPLNQMSISAKIRIATLGNAFERAVLIRDPVKLVAVAAIKSPGVSEIEAARFAGATSLHEEVIRVIASRRDWTRLYGIKLSLSMNPKTPIPDVTRMLPHLRPKDLERVAKSKGVPSAVVAQARKLIIQRGSGSKK